MVLKMEQVETAQILMDGLVFRAVTASPMVVSTTLVSAVTGGVLRRTMQPMLGPAICSTPMTTYTGTAAIRDSVFLSVASGINFCDKRGQSKVYFNYAVLSKKDEIILNGYYEKDSIRIYSTWITNTCWM